MTEDYEPIVVDLDSPVNMDLDEVQDELIPAGWHSVTIERAEARLSSKQQIPQIFVMSRITDEGDPDFNRTIIWSLNLAGPGMGFFKRCFAALGMPEKLNYNCWQDMADEIVGREVDAKVKHGTYNNEPQAQVSTWRPTELLEF